MKRNGFIVLMGCMVVLFSACVTKQKYQELESSYKKCQDELTYTTSERIDFENKTKELTQEVERLTTIVEKMKADTLSLSRQFRQLQRDCDKAKRDYDALLKNFAESNMSNNAEMNKLLVDIDKMKQELDVKEQDLEKQSSELEIMSVNLSAKEQRLAELQNILDRKDAEVKVLKDKVMQALKGFENSGLNVYERKGKVYVSMDEKLLFASGSWEVNVEGEKAIKELAVVLENDSNINILIEGHTDNVPYRGSAQVKDNWDLSVMRATSVVKSLLKYGHIIPQRISASGRGEHYPLESENTTEARAKNRRTEIILTPKLDELFQILDAN